MLKTETLLGGTKITDTWEGIKFVVYPGSRFSILQIFVNHGWRDAVLVDRWEADLLIEYEMPNGRFYLQEWTATVGGSFKYAKTINRNNPPVKWRQSIKAWDNV